MKQFYILQKLLVGMSSIPTQKNQGYSNLGVQINKKR